MTYSLTILKVVSPLPGKNASGKMRAKTRDRVSPRTTRKRRDTNPSEDGWRISSGATIKASVCSERATIQSCVARLLV